MYPNPQDRPRKVGILRFAEITFYSFRNAVACAYSVIDSEATVVAGQRHGLAKLTYQYAVALGNKEHRLYPVAMLQNPFVDAPQCMEDPKNIQKLSIYGIAGDIAPRMPSKALPHPDEAMMQVLFDRAAGAVTSPKYPVAPLTAPSFIFTSDFGAVRAVVFPVRPETRHTRKELTKLEERGAGPQGRRRARRKLAKAS